MRACWVEGRRMLVDHSLAVGLLAGGASVSAQVVYNYQIPDPGRPIPDDARGSCGPSGELIAFEPGPLRSADVIGRRIDAISSIVGTYGMGGPGFFGFRLGEEWLVIAIWGAGDWLRADGRLVTDVANAGSGRSEPWIDGDSDRLSPLVVGRTIASVSVETHALRIEIDNGIAFVVDADPATRPAFLGNGAPRAFSETDDLGRAVFLAPTPEIWV